MPHNRTLRFAAILVAASFMFISLTAVRLRTTSSEIQADFINVGQGDSILLRDGNGFDVLVDGGRPAAGPTVVAYLREHGITELDVMVASHADADHIGGLVTVLQASDISVLQVLYNGYPGTTATWATFATEVANDGMTPVPAQFPGEYVWGGMNAYVLHPDAGLVSPDQNESSVVLLVQHGDVGFLLTGDIGDNAEATVVARGTSVAAEVLKVGHHGSRYSSSASFLAAVGSNDAVIQVGTNSYGHPTSETLDRLAAAGARVWRNDTHGTVTIISDGGGYNVAGIGYIVYLPVVVKHPTPTPTVTLTAMPSVTATGTSNHTATAPPTGTTVPTATNPPSNCDPSYPTVCISPPPPDLDCGDIPYRRFQVLQPDPHRFDSDKDGVGCESG